MRKFVKRNYFTKERREEFVRDIRYKLLDTKDWIIEHKNEVIVLTPVVVGSLTTIIKVVGRSANLRKQESIKNLYCYDPSLGHYWKLKRRMSNREWLEVDRRKYSGERLADILADMKVLK